MQKDEIIIRIQNLRIQILQARSLGAVPVSSIAHFKSEIGSICQSIPTKVPADVLSIARHLTSLVEHCALDQLLDSEINYAFIASRARACALQMSLDLDELQKTLQSCKQMVKKYLNFSNAKFFAFQSTAMRNKKQYLGRHAYLKLRYFLVYIETLLQQTATLSQQGKHLEALEKSSECFNRLKVAGA